MRAVTTDRLLSGRSIGHRRRQVVGVVPGQRKRKSTATCQQAARCAPSNENHVLSQPQTRAGSTRILPSARAMPIAERSCASWKLARAKCALSESAP